MKENGLKAIQRAKMSPQDHTTKHCYELLLFSSKIKSNIVKPVLSGHSKRRPNIGFQDQLS